MQTFVPTACPALDFEPVPRKYRYDGWTAERQRAFIAALAETGSIKAAARRINMSPEGAYYLRRQPGADGFRAAWIAALDHGVQRLADIAVERAIEGVPVPIHWRGEQIGEKRWYNDRLLMFILRHHLADRYGGPGLAHGTRSRETIEREAAENCPVCKARAQAEEAAEAEANPNAGETKARAAWLADLLQRYAAKVRYERRARLHGDVVAADFAVRQITHIEFLLAASDGSAECFALWQGMERAGSVLPGEEEVYAIGICRLLDRTRHAVWAEQGMLRPLSSPADGTAAFTTPSGEAAEDRIAAQHHARTRLAAAQALWEAAATEEGWRAWCRRDVSSVADVKEG